MMMMGYISNAQTTNNCKDSAAADINFNCGNDIFNPVCGCDFITYRSECAAQRRAGIFFGNWTQGGCNVLAFEITPSIVTYYSPSIRLWVNPDLFPINATVLIHDVFGRKKFVESFILPLDYIDNNFLLREVNLNSLDKGIYVMTISVAGIEESTKFIKLPNE